MPRARARPSPAHPNVDALLGLQRGRPLDEAAEVYQAVSRTVVVLHDQTPGLTGETLGALAISLVRAGISVR